MLDVLNECTHYDFSGAGGKSVKLEHAGKDTSSRTESSETPFLSPLPATEGAVEEGEGMSLPVPFHMPSGCVSTCSEYSIKTCSMYKHVVHGIPPG
jgi:hypothetical protein